MSRKEKGKEPGEFGAKKRHYAARQAVFDGCKRAREGAEDVWVTVHSADHDQLVRVKLAPGDPEEGDFHSYACDAGHGAILMLRGTPTYFCLHGKDGKVYVPTGTMDSLAFAKKVMALVACPEDVHLRRGAQA